MAKKALKKEQHEGDEKTTKKGGKKAIKELTNSGKSVYK